MKITKNQLQKIILEALAAAPQSVEEWMYWGGGFDLSAEEDNDGQTIFYVEPDDPNFNVITREAEQAGASVETDNSGQAVVYTGVRNMPSPLPRTAISSQQVEDYLRSKADEYRRQGVTGKSMETLLMDDFMDDLGHQHDAEDYEGYIRELVLGESKLKITKRQLKRLIREERARLLREQDAPPDPRQHHYPSADQEISQVVEELANSWHEMELKAWSAGDPSMNMQGELSDSESKELWGNQVEAATEEFRDTLQEKLRATTLSVMEEFTEKLINGDFV